MTDRTKAGYKKYRYFGGQRFHIEGSTSVKRLANEVADDWRERGYNARVVKWGNKQIYLIYIRKK